jgi:L-alanine-DL-glutamate epimerase-like enolase superfamily enzyme
MLDIKYKKINTEFHYPFTTAHGLKTHQPALLVAISFNGFMGIGEAPAIVYYDVTVDSMIAELNEKVNVLERYAFTEPDRFWHFCHHLFPTNPFLVCALDIAYWNLYAQFKRKSVAELWSLSPSLKVANPPLTDYTIGIDRIEKMVEKMKDNPSPIYKIKLGTKEDVAIMQALRQHTDAPFRVDANAGWDLDTALEMIPVLKNLGVELVEQPLAKEHWEGMKILKSQSCLPLFADEACVSEHDVKKCAEVFDGINIKLTKCSGITPAIRMIEEARQLNLKIMMGCMNETEIGSVAIAHFIPWLDYVDVDGPLLLKVGELKQLNYDFGKVTFK